MGCECYAQIVDPARRKRVEGIFNPDKIPLKTALIRFHDKEGNTYRVAETKDLTDEQVKKLSENVYMLNEKTKLTLEQIQHTIKKIGCPILEKNTITSICEFCMRNIVMVNDDLDDFGFDDEYPDDYDDSNYLGED